MEQLIINHIDLLSSNEIFNFYLNGLSKIAKKGKIELPNIPDYATKNGHMFYIVCKNLEHRNALIGELKRNGIMAVFHYLSLHKSDFYANKYTGENLINSDLFTDTLLRLPLYFEMNNGDLSSIINVINNFHA